MPYTQIEYAAQDGVATLTLNRPDRMNALTTVMETELRQAMEAADADPAVRAILLTGAGRAFCAGYDVDELEAFKPEEMSRAPSMRTFDMGRRADYQTRYSYFPAISKPVITAINGAAAGLGLILALYSDIRLASEKAVFSTALSRRGLIAEHGIAWMLPRIVGHANAMDLLFSARKFAAQEALQMGLVNRVVPHDELIDSARAYAQELADWVSPRSLRVIKRQLWASPYQTLAEAVMVANQEMQTSFQSDDFKEGVRHFVEKRKPQFTGQ